MSQLQGSPSLQQHVAWWRRAGRRNLAYVAFLVLLIPFGMAIEASGPQGPDRGGGIWAALLVWALGSLVFLVVNAVLLVIALAKGRPMAKPAIACAMPFVSVAILLVLVALP